MNQNWNPSEKGTSTLYTFDNPEEAQGKTHAQLVANGWEEIYSFNLKNPDHADLVRQKIEEAREDGKYYVIRVRADEDDSLAREAGVAYLLKKPKKPNP